MPGYGARGHLGIFYQQSGGTLQTASGYFIPLNTEGIVHEIEPLMEGDFTRYGFSEPPTAQGQQIVQGPVEFEPYPEAFGAIAAAFFGVASTTFAGSATDTIFALRDTGDWDDSFALPPRTMEIYRGVGSAFRFQDGQINRLILSQEPGGYLKGSIEVLGRGMVLDTALTPTWETWRPWRWDTLSVAFGGAGFADLEGFELNLLQNVEGIPTLGSSFCFGHTKRTGLQEARLNGTLSFNNPDEYAKFAAGSEQAVSIFYPNPLNEVTSGYFSELTIDIPHFRYDSHPVQMGGAGRIQVSFTGRAVIDTTSLYTVQLTLRNGIDGYLT